MTDHAHTASDGRGSLPTPTWQPIETAPKDGTLVDLWVVAPRKAWVASGRGRVPDAWFYNGSWRTYDEHGDDGWTEVHNVTHWMPIPAPPQDPAHER